MTAAPASATQRDAARRRLAEIGKEITVKLGKADQHEFRRDDMLTSVNELIKEAKQLCEGYSSVMSFAVFKDKFCPTLGKSAAYDLRAQILGTKTKKQLLLANRERQQKHRVKVKRAKADRFRYVTENSPLANKTVALFPDNSMAVIPTTPVPAGNDRPWWSTEPPGPGQSQADTDASAAQAENAKLQGVTSPASKSTPVGVTAMRAAKDARSKAALKKLNAAIDECLLEMNTTEKQSAFDYFKLHPKMVGVKRKAA